MNYSQKVDSLVLKIFDVGGIKFGSYMLKSGLVTPIYIDIRSLVSFPSILQDLCEIIWEHLKIESSCPLDDTDFIAGVPYSAIPIASFLSVHNKLPMILVRKEKKSYGTNHEIEGIFQTNQSCLIIEDVVTSGTSILETKHKLEREGLIVKYAVAFIDRDQGGVEQLAQNGITLLPVTSMKDLIRILENNFKINSETAKTVLQFVENNKELISI